MTTTPLSQIRDPEDWDKADIKSALEKAGWSLRKLSRHHGFNGTTLAIALRKPYPNAERIIAKAIGIKPEAIWPSRYDHRRPFRGNGGAPTHNKRQVCSNKCTTAAQRCNVKEFGENRHA